MTAEAKPLQHKAEAWTGGQYSLFRVLLGSTALVALLTHTPGTADWNHLVVSDLLTKSMTWGKALAWWANLMGIVAAMLLMLGRWDRWMVPVLLLTVPLRYLDPMKMMLFTLLAVCLCFHALVKSKPFGALDATSRNDPVGDWYLHSSLHLFAWLFLLGICLASGSVNVIDPLLPAARPYGVIQLLFVVLSIHPKTRPWGFLVLAPAVLLTPFFGAPWVHLQLLLLMYFCFNPAWMPPRVGEEPMLLFYDGHCGLCHRSIRFVLSEDPSGKVFQFSPLQGETITKVLDEEAIKALPDSLVLRLNDGRILTKSTAALSVLEACGGIWRPIAMVGLLVPRFMRDRIYEGIAKIRYRIFGKQKDLCPMMPARMRAQFVP